MEELENLVNWIIENLREGTPFHLLRFFPSYKVMDLPPTSEETLEKAYDLAEDRELDYVYVGNLRDGRNNTHCPECGELRIERSDVSMMNYKIEDGKCPSCSHDINIAGEKWTED